MTLKNRNLLVIGAAVIAGSLGFLAMNSYAKSKDKQSSVSSCEVTECVSLSAGKASPDTLAVPVGSFIQFNSADGKKYSLTLGEPHDAGQHGTSHAAGDSAFSSGEFGEGEAWRVQFKDRGTYVFTDKLNPNLNMLVVVYQPGGDYKIR